MQFIFGILSYSVLICQVLHVSAHYNPFYLMECPLICPEDDDHPNVNQRMFKTAFNRKDSKVDEMASDSRGNGFYRPRSALARAFYEKQYNDRYLEGLDQSEHAHEYVEVNHCVPNSPFLNYQSSKARMKKMNKLDKLLYQWYRVNKERLSPELLETFVQLYPDEETKRFLSSSIDKSSWVWTQCWYLLAKAVLRHFWSVTDINGWLGRGSMFVLSEAQAKALITPGGRSKGAGTLVDVGAGDGEVSRRFAHLYPHNYATEISASMRKTLAHKGYKILDSESWWRNRKFDCICMLNLLDRCNKPKTMLVQAREAVALGGVLILALVLPYKPYVEGTTDHQPEERLPIEGCDFETQVASFVKFMREVIGFELIAWSRAPYLCEGDFAQAYYWLDDSVYTFKPIHVPTPPKTF